MCWSEIIFSLCLHSIKWRNPELRLYVKRLLWKSKWWETFNSLASAWPVQSNNTVLLACALWLCDHCASLNVQQLQIMLQRLACIHWNKHLGRIHWNKFGIGLTYSSKSTGPDRASWTLEDGAGPGQPDAWRPFKGNHFISVFFTASKNSLSSLSGRNDYYFGIVCAINSTVSSRLLTQKIVWRMIMFLNKI